MQPLVVTVLLMLTCFFGLGFIATLTMAHDDEMYVRLNIDRRKRGKEPITRPWCRRWAWICGMMTVVCLSTLVELTR